MKKYPMALTPPSTEVTRLNEQLLQKVIDASHENPRKRMIQPLHKDDSSTLHRMFNAMQPGSYFRPHHHLAENKCEAIIVLKGAVRVIFFSKSGEILEFYDLKAGSDFFGIDIEPDQIHTLCVLEKDTVIFEVKPGPYVRSTDKGFMEWAPEEETHEAKKVFENAGIVGRLNYWCSFQFQLDFENQFRFCTAYLPKIINHDNDFNNWIFGSYVNDDFIPSTSGANYSHKKYRRNIVGNVPTIFNRCFVLVSLWNRKQRSSRNYCQRNYFNFCIGYFGIQNQVSLVISLSRNNLLKTVETKCYRIQYCP